MSEYENKLEETQTALVAALADARAYATAYALEQAANELERERVRELESALLEIKRDNPEDSHAHRVARSVLPCPTCRKGKDACFEARCAGRDK